MSSNGEKNSSNAIEWIGEVQETQKPLPPGLAYLPNELQALIKLLPAGLILQLEQCCNGQTNPESRLDWNEMTKIPSAERDLFLEEALFRFIRSVAKPINSWVGSDGVKHPKFYGLENPDNPGSASVFVGNVLEDFWRNRGILDLNKIRTMHDDYYAWFTLEHMRLRNAVQVADAALNELLLKMRAKERWTKAQAAKRLQFSKASKKASEELWTFSCEHELIFDKPDAPIHRQPHEQRAVRDGALWAQFYNPEELAAAALESFELELAPRRFWANGPDPGQIHPERDENRLQIIAAVKLGLAGWVAGHKGESAMISADASAASKLKRQELLLNHFADLAASWEANGARGEDAFAELAQMRNLLNILVKQQLS